MNMALAAHYEVVAGSQAQITDSQSSREEYLLAYLEDLIK